MASLGLSSALQGLSSSLPSHNSALKGEVLCTGLLVCHGCLLNRSGKSEHDVQWVCGSDRFTCV